MNIFEIWLLAITLALDCLTVSIAGGTAVKQIRVSHLLTMALSFGLFQAFMPIIGWGSSLALSSLIESIDHWIAFGLLAAIGAKMIKESFEEHEDKSFDMGSFKTILILSVATSIDALAVGVTFTCVGMNTLALIASPIAIIGFVSFAFSIVGVYTGAKLRSRTNWPMERVGGVVLILLGLKILIQHTTTLL